MVPATDAAEAADVGSFGIHSAAGAVFAAEEEFANRKMVAVVAVVARAVAGAGSAAAPATAAAVDRAAVRASAEGEPVASEEARRMPIGSSLKIEPDPDPALGREVRIPGGNEELGNSKVGMVQHSLVGPAPCLSIVPGSGSTG